jgi:hypothetical protein
MRRVSIVLVQSWALRFLSSSSEVSRSEFERATAGKRRLVRRRRARSRCQDARQSRNSTATGRRIAMEAVRVHETNGSIARVAACCVPVAGHAITPTGSRSNSLKISLVALAFFCAGCANIQARKEMDAAHHAWSECLAENPYHMDQCAKLQSAYEDEKTRYEHSF